MRSPSSPNMGSTIGRSRVLLSFYSFRGDRIAMDAICSSPEQSARMLSPDYSDQDKELELDTELEVVEEEPKVHLFDCLLDDEPLDEGCPRTLK
jgi:hypothetical protein